MCIQQHSVTNIWNDECENNFPNYFVGELIKKKNQKKPPQNLKKECVWNANRSLKILFVLVQDLEFENSMCLTFTHFFPHTRVFVRVMYVGLGCVFTDLSFWYSLKIPKWLIPPGFDLSLKSQTIVLVCCIFCFTGIFFIITSILSFYPTFCIQHLLLFLFS